MVSHTPQAAEGLRSADRAVRVKALKSLKNEIIGSRSKKLQLLCLLPDVVALANRAEVDREELIQSAATLGSFAYGVDDGVRAVVAQGAVQTLLRALGSGDEAVVEAAARSLKLIFRSPLAPHDPLLQPPALRTLVGLLGATKPHLAEVAASVVARCCGTPEECATVAAAGAVPALLAMLASPRPTTQQAALEALAAMVGGAAAPLGQASGSDAGAAGQVTATRSGTEALPLHLSQLLEALSLSAPVAAPSTSDKQQQQQRVQPPQAVAPPTPRQAALLAQLLSLLRQSPTSATRFRVAVVVAGLLRAAAAVSEAEGAPQQPQQEEQREATVRQLQDASRVVLPGLVKLLQQTVSQAEGGAISNGAAAGRSAAAASAPQQQPWILWGGGAASGAECVPGVLADLMAADEDLVKAALDADAVKLLCSCLAAAAAAGGEGSKPGSTQQPAAAAARQLRAGALRALGALCLRHEDARSQVVSAKAVPHIAASLGDADDASRAAAALCVRGLSNSARSLRSCVVDSGLAAPLVKLLADEATAVQVSAVSAICNLVLDFRSVRQAVLQAGALRMLVPLTGSMVPELRSASVRALTNLTIKCEDAATRQALLRELSWGALRALLADCEPEVATEAAALLQNLFAASSDGIQELFSWSAGDLLPLLEERLDPTAAANSAAGPRGLEATLYAVANLCSGSEEHKAAVMSSNVPTLLLHQLRSPSTPAAGGEGSAAAVGEGSAAAACGPGSGGSSGGGVRRVRSSGGGEAAALTAAQLRVPAVWSVINLLWYDSAAHPSAPPAEVAARAQALRELGLEAALRDLQQDSHQDLRERVQTALEQLALQV